MALAGGNGWSSPDMIAQLHKQLAQIKDWAGPT
jgi:hypothetical protein